MEGRFNYAKVAPAGTKPWLAWSGIFINADWKRRCSI